MKQTKKTTSRDLTKGNIAVQVLLFSLPLMLGNVFQMLYNTVDSIVVGNFVGTQALAAVGSTTMIVNLFVFFFTLSHHQLIRLPQILRRYWLF